MTNTATNKSLLVLLFNANGLKNHILELQTVLNNKRIDIALITETHCTPYSHLNIPGYRIHKANHPDNTAHGGVAILVKSSLVYHSLPSFSEDIIQSCAIQIHVSNVPITVAAIYSPPKHKISYENFSNYFNTIKNNFIIGGDYNAKHQSWGC
jgi:exonuclease III